MSIEENYNVFISFLNKHNYLLVVRLGIDGPQAEQLEFVLCGQILQNSRRGEKPCPA